MAGGYRSLLGYWGGGAGATGHGGYRSLLAFWAGGATGVTPTSSGGYRSLLAFWMGGASAGAAVHGSPGREDYQLAWERLQQRGKRNLRIHRDDTDMLELLTMFTGQWEC